MTTLLRSDYDIELDNIWYGSITDEQIRSSLFDSDAWNDIDSEKYWCILTFDDIRSDFESWSPEDRTEYLGEDNTEDYTVYDWIRDCMMNSLSVVKSITRKEC